MAATSHRSVTVVVPPSATLKPASHTLAQDGNQLNGQTDKVRTTEANGTDGNISDHIYDQINLSAARSESGEDPYTPLRSDQNEVIESINTKLDSLESNQNRLASQFHNSQTLILSELSQVKEMVKTLNDLVKTSLTTFQKMSAQHENHVQELAANLGQEVFHVGQEVMTTIRERNDEDMALRTWRQEVEADRMTSQKKSKTKALPSL